jgi:hypothetical protein
MRQIIMSTAAGNFRDDTPHLCGLPRPCPVPSPAEAGLPVRCGLRQILMMKMASTIGSARRQPPGWRWLALASASARELRSHWV